MPNIVHTITLRHSFLWSNRYLMGKLTPMQRKMFFLVFVVLNPLAPCYCGQEVRIPLSVIGTFLGSESNEKNLPQALKVGFDAIAAAMLDIRKNASIPFTYKGIKGDEARFIIQDPKAFHDLGNALACEFDLDEISSYASGSARDNHTIPLLWYIKCVVVKALYDFKNMEGKTNYPHVEFIANEDGELVKLLITVGHEELKKVMGYGPYDYTNIPKGNRPFFLDFIDFMNRMRPLEALAIKDPSALPPEERGKIEWATQKLQDERRAFSHKYADVPFADLEKKYQLLRKKLQHRRQPFIDRVVKPAITEINQGNMIYFGVIDNDRRPQRRSQAEIEAGVPIREAIHEMSPVRNNYEMQDTDNCVLSCILLDDHGHVVGEDKVFSQLVNYRKRRLGEEYTLCVELSRPLAFASQVTEKMEELPFTVGDFYKEHNSSNALLMLDTDDD